MVQQMMMTMMQQPQFLKISEKLWRLGQRRRVNLTLRSRSAECQTSNSKQKSRGELAQVMGRRG